MKLDGEALVVMECDLQVVQTCEVHRAASHRGSRDVVQAVYGCRTAAARGCASLAWRMPLLVEYRRARMQ